MGKSIPLTERLFLEFDICFNKNIAANNGPSFAIYVYKRQPKTKFTLKSLI